MKKPTLKGLKAKAWALCSIYVRLRDSDEYGYGKCVTCPENVPLRHYKEVDAGHYIHGKNKPTGYMEENINYQCTTCNYYKRAEASRAYDIFMLNKYGQEWVDNLRSLSKKFVKQNKDYYIELISNYRNKVLNLSTEKDSRVAEDIIKRYGGV